LGQLRRDYQAFSDKYGIKVNSAQPDAASQDEINAANQQKGKSTAPDAFDLGQSVALANTSKFAPYKVATWDDIAAAYKDPNGAWVNDYGGYMSIASTRRRCRRSRASTTSSSRSTTARSR